MRIINLIRKAHPAILITVPLLVTLVGVTGYLLLQRTGGQFSLPGDEAFLQLSTAKTLAFRHIWGIGRYEFTTASSSLLYPIPLAAVFFIFGANLLVIPLINTAIAVLLLIVMQKWLAKRAIAAVSQVLILLAVIVLTPLPVLVIYGMEGTLLLLLAFLFISRVSDEWSLPEFSRNTLIYGALMVATRYDGVVLVVIVFVLLLWRRTWLAAFELALWCLLPVLVFGIVNVFKGGYFLPNIIMMGCPGAFFSYDWLIGIGIVIAVPLLPPYAATRSGLANRKVMGLTVLFAVFFLCTRNLYAYQESDDKSVGLYRTEYPAAAFVRRYYNQYSIVSDNMGMISFLTEGRFLDLSGRASITIARSKIDRSFSPDLVRELSRRENVHLAVISDLYDQPVPDSWIRTAMWETRDKRTVSFYAVDTSIAGTLRKNLEEYAFFLPADLTVRYFYPSAPDGKRKGR